MYFEMERKSLLFMARLISVLLLVFVPLVINAQLLPQEGSSLNYRLIGFSFPPVNTGSNYTIEIAAGTFNSQDSFSKNVIKTITAKTNKVIAEVPSFGAQYTWRITCSGGKPDAHISDLYHFSTSIIPNVDTNKMRLRLIKPTGRYNGSYVFLDGNKVLYDMNGNPVWYLPDIDGLLKNSYMDFDAVRDMKLTKRGTITLLIGDHAYEINYNGKIIWSGPRSGTVSREKDEGFHHELTRLSNGHYMVLGNEYVTGKQENSVGGISANPKSVRPGMRFQRMNSFGTVIEYDEKGNVVWYWKSAKYYGEMDLYNSSKPDGKKENDIHENAFFFDEQNKFLYVSFKNISQIVKIKYPEGNVVNTYGVLYKPGGDKTPNSLFCEQHSCRLSKKGCLMLFNNNVCNRPAPPKIVMFRQPVAKNDSLKKIWEFACPDEVMAERTEGRLNATSGGNAIELGDLSLFASMCSPYANTFIVGPDKKIIWNALPEQWDSLKNKWVPFGQYRASIFTAQKDLEALIWSTQ
jgi:hypothetical protein